VAKKYKIKAEDVKAAELPGMPKRSKAGDKVIEYLNLRDQAEKAKEDMESSRDEMVNLMLTEGKKSINVGGRVVSVSEKNGFRVTVKTQSDMNF